MKKADLLGRKFGLLLAVSAAPSDARGQSRWLCRCECGKQTTLKAYNLVNGHTRSCGCLRAPFDGTHATPTYRIWSGIISRCTSPGTSRYAYYGARGVTVCKRWLLYESFLADMGERPPKMQIERIDNDGHYEPSNCRWATRNEQQRNKRSNRILVLGKERITLAEASERFGLKANTIRKRLDLGWSPVSAVTVPLRAAVA
jgi:hypothetical protein